MIQKLNKSPFDMFFIMRLYWYANMKKEFVTRCGGEFNDSEDLCC